MPVRLDQGAGRDATRSPDASVQNLTTGGASRGIASGLLAAGQALGGIAARQQSILDAEQKQAERELAQQRSAQNAVEATKIISQFQIENAEDLTASFDAYDGQSDLRTPLMERVEARRQAALERVGDNADLRGLVDRQMIELSGRQSISVIQTERQARASATAQNLGEAVDVTANGILSGQVDINSALDNVRLLAAGVPESRRAQLVDAAEGVLYDAFISREVTQAPDDFEARLNAGDYDEDLSPAQKSRALNQIQSERKKREAEAARVKREQDREAALTRRIEAVALESDLSAHYASVQQSGVGVDGVSYERVLELKGPVAAARFKAKDQEARKVHGALSSLPDMAVSDMPAVLKGLAPTPGQKGFDQQQSVFEAAQRLVQTEIKARERDPAGLVLTRNPSLQALREQIADEARPPQERTALQSQYIEASLAAQTELGLPPSAQKVLSVNEASNLVAAIQSAPPYQAAEIMESVSAYGPRQAKVVGELITAGLPPEAEMFWSLSESPAAQAIFAQGLKDQDVLKKTISSSDRRDIKEKAEKALGPLFDSFAVSPEASRLRDSVGSSVSLMAQVYVARGAEQKEAVKMAAAAFTEKYDFQENYRIPKVVGEGAKKTYLDSRAISRATGSILDTVVDLRDRGLTVNYVKYDGLTEEDLWWDAPGDKRLSEEFRRQEYGKAIRRHGRWVNNADETGLVLMINTGGFDVPVKNRNGVTVELDWQSLSGMGGGFEDLGGIGFKGDNSEVALARRLLALGAE